MAVDAGSLTLLKHRVRRTIGLLLRRVSSRTALGDGPGSVTAAVHHDENDILRRDTGGCYGSPRQARGLPSSWDGKLSKFPSLGHSSRKRPTRFSFRSLPSALQHVLPRALLPRQPSKSDQCFVANKRTDVSPYAYFIDIVERLRRMRTQYLTSKSILVGPPEKIVEDLREIDASEISEVILYFSYGLKPAMMVEEQMHRFMEEIAPHFEGA